MEKRGQAQCCPNVDFQNLCNLININILKRKVTVIDLK